jgi:uncharacterized cupredoxin-like copper-binding protein
MKHRILVFFSAMLLLVLAACGGEPRPVEEERPGAVPAEQVAQESAAPAAESLSVEMGDIYFEEGPTNIDNPPVWQVGSGAEITLELNNIGNLDHNWAIVALGQEVPDPYLGGEDQPGLFYWSADVVPPGETEIHAFTAPTEPGSYQVICTVPGHYPAMQGVLEIQ